MMPSEITAAEALALTAADLDQAIAWFKQTVEPQRELSAQYPTDEPGYQSILFEEASLARFQLVLEAVAGNLKLISDQKVKILAKVEGGAA